MSLMKTVAVTLGGLALVSSVDAECSKIVGDAVKKGAFKNGIPTWRNGDLEFAPNAVEKIEGRINGGVKIYGPFRSHTGTIVKLSNNNDDDLLTLDVVRTKDDEPSFGNQASLEEHECTVNTENQNDVFCYRENRDQGDNNDPVWVRVTADSNLKYTLRVYTENDGGIVVPRDLKPRNLTVDWHTVSPKIEEAIQEADFKGDYYLAEWKNIDEEREWEFESDTGTLITVVPRNNGKVSLTAGRKYGNQDECRSKGKWKQQCFIENDGDLVSVKVTPEGGAEYDIQVKSDGKDNSDDSKVNFDYFAIFKNCSESTELSPTDGDSTYSRESSSSESSSSERESSGGSDDSADNCNNIDTDFEDEVAVFEAAKKRFAKLEDFNMVNHDYFYSQNFAVKAIGIYDFIFVSAKAMCANEVELTVVSRENKCTKVGDGLVECLIESPEFQSSHKTEISWKGSAQVHVWRLQKIN